MANLYLLTPRVFSDYTNCDKAIVCAESEYLAKQVSPSGTLEYDTDGEYNEDFYIGWVATSMLVDAQLIGVAENNIKINSVVLATYF